MAATSATLRTSMRPVRTSNLVLMMRGQQVRLQSSSPAATGSVGGAGISLGFLLGAATTGAVSYYYYQDNKTTSRRETALLAERVSALQKEVDGLTTLRTQMELVLLQNAAGSAAGSGGNDKEGSNKSQRTWLHVLSMQAVKHGVGFGVKKALKYGWESFAASSGSEGGSDK